MPVPDVSTIPLADLISLRGRAAVVTGGGRGLGKAIASRLAEAGASVVIGDLDGALAEDAAAELAARHGADVVGATMDVTDRASVRAVGDLVDDRWGRVDAWVNNAGVFPSVALTEMRFEDWDRVFAVNARGVLVGTQEAARFMTHQERGGVVVNVVSTAGFRGSAPGLAAYVGSKHAARGITRQTALELAPHGIRVLGVAPSYVPTEGNLLAAAAAMPEGVELPDLADLPDDVPLMMTSPAGRTGTPDDIARVVLFCVSDLSMYMTGSTLLADGGTTA
jgi:NAD(P)-dependent dehydrogenase (short-subunit alcohol dehydrogenase family)